MSKTIKLRFRPQAWINDYAVDVDPEGATTWDVPANVIDFNFDEEHLDRDHLRFEGDAPQWIQDWSGPFEVEMAQYADWQDYIDSLV